MTQTETHEFEKSVMPWIGKTGKMIFAYMVDKFRKNGFDLSMEQMIILKILHEQDGRPQNDMAMVTDRHKASLTRLIDNLQKKNLVVRIPDPSDKRVNRIFLTKNGRKYFQSILPVVKEAMHELQAGLSEKEISDLIKILKKVQNNLVS